MNNITKSDNKVAENSKNVSKSFRININKDDNPEISSMGNKQGDYGDKDNPEISESYNIYDSETNNDNSSLDQIQTLSKQNPKKLSIHESIKKDA
jgi:hypothetical protein